MSSPKVASSLYLQIMIYCHKYWLGLYFVLSLLMFIYKRVSFPYRSSVYGWELTLFTFMMMMDGGRLVLGTQGNLKEMTRPLFMYLVLCLILIFTHVFFLRNQTYVLALDESLNIVGIVLQSLEFVLGVVAVMMIKKQA